MPDPPGARTQDLNTSRIEVNHLNHRGDRLPFVLFVPVICFLFECFLLFLYFIECVCRACRYWNVIALPAAMLTAHVAT